MQALTVTPGKKDSLRLLDIPDPAAEQGPVFVETLAVGLCGTDMVLELASGSGSADART
ncbi:hypothetical protein AB6813_00235 [bacterium RCC_150]